MRVEDKVRHIVTMQMALNERTVPNWLSKGLDWDTAILVEVAEAIDSTDWKWWKHTETDLANLRVEAVDLLHFLVSKALDGDHDADHVVFRFSQLAKQTLPQQTAVAWLKAIAAHTLNNEVDKALMSLLGLFAFLQMDIEAIYQAYITKNLLNHYRQERGYKDPNGGYLKIINGEEDNVVFASLVKKQADQAGDLEYLRKRLFDAMDQVVTQARAKT